MPFLLSYILRYVSFSEVVIVYRVPFREPMHLCTYVSEEGDNGEDAVSEAPSLMRKRELKTRLIYEDRFDERLKN